MDASLNLTPERGPSVWDRLDRRATERRGHVTLIAAGALLAAWWLRRRSIRQIWPVALAAGAAGAYWSGLSPANLTVRRRRAPGAQDDAMVDVAVEDSFPASDPPSSMQVE